MADIYMPNGNKIDPWIRFETKDADGNGKDPGASELLNVGTAAGLSHAKCRKIIEEIEEIVRSELGGYII